MNSITKFEIRSFDYGDIATSKKLGDTSYEYHWHDYYELILYVNCNGYCTINDVNYPIKDKCLYLVTPKDFHKIENEKDDSAYYVKISFSSNTIAPEILNGIITSPIQVLNVPDPLINDIERVHKNVRAGNDLSKKYAVHLLNCIIIDISRIGTALDSANTSLSPIVQKAITRIITAPTKKHSVKDISRELGINPDYFSSLFSRETGVTFIKYLTALRIDYARNLLKNSEASVLEACFESGFNSPAHFYKTFKKHTGHSPEEYKRLNKNPQST